MLRPQDILILLKVLGLEGKWRQQDIARALHLSQAEIHYSLGRSAVAGLYDAHQRQVNRRALLEFLVHGLKYVFPGQLGASARGFPTAWGGPPLVEHIVAEANDVPVWPHHEGTTRGFALEPLHPSAPEAAHADPKLYELLALIDAIRIGRARERKLAIEGLEKRLGA